MMRKDTQVQLFQTMNQGQQQLAPHQGRQQARCSHWKKGGRAASPSRSTNGLQSTIRHIIQLRLILLSQNKFSEPRKVTSSYASSRLVVFGEEEISFLSQPSIESTTIRQIHRKEASCSSPPSPITLLRHFLVRAAYYIVDLADC